MKKKTVIFCRVTTGLAIATGVTAVMLMFELVPIDVVISLAYVTILLAGILAGAKLQSKGKLDASVIK